MLVYDRLDVNSHWHDTVLQHEQRSNEQP